MIEIGITVSVIITAPIPTNLSTVCDVTKQAQTLQTYETQNRSHANLASNRLTLTTVKCSTVVQWLQPNTGQGLCFKLCTTY